MAAISTFGPSLASWDLPHVETGRFLLCFSSETHLHNAWIGRIMSDRVRPVDFVP
jgi:hypothetical protein